MSHIIICDRCGQRWMHDDTIVSNYCGTCAGKVFMGMNTEEQLELSIIYTRLLKDLDDTPNMHQRLQLIDDAFNRAYEVKRDHALDGRNYEE